MREHSRRLSESPQRIRSSDVVDAVARREGVDPIDLEPKLYDVIDPDSLDALLATGPTDSESAVSVNFHYAGYDVVVGSDGTLELERTPKPVER